MGKKAKSDPSPKALLTVKGGGTTSRQESAIKYKTQDPRWEEGFKFLVHNPEIQVRNRQTDRQTDREESAIKKNSIPRSQPRDTGV